jgi:REP element-mobilizing transposase RayT
VNRSRLQKRRLWTERYESLHHTKWECKYHLVWIPKCRKKVLCGQLRRDLGPILRKLALQKESEMVEGKLKVDHVHMVVSIPPKYSVSQVVGYVKGKVRSGLQGQRGGGGIFWVRIFGHVAIVFQQLAWMKRRYGNMSEARKRLIRNQTN